MGFLKGIPLAKKTAAIVALLAIVGGIAMYDWMGIRSAFAVPPEAITPAPTPGVPRFSVTGSETHASLLYDEATRTFNMKIRENTTSGNLQLWDYDAGAYATEAADTTVTYTLTLFREDIDPNAQIGEVTIGTMPTFTVSGDVNIYCVVDKTTADKWEVSITPAGGSARYEYNTALVTGGSSKAFDVVIYFDYSGVNKATDGTIHTSTYSGGPPGTDFRLNTSVEPSIA